MLHSRMARRTPAKAGSFGAWVGANGDGLWLISIPPNEHPWTKTGWNGVARLRLADHG
jgi:hypothetical protein